MGKKKITTSVVATLLLATNLLSEELGTITVVSATKSEQSIKDITSNVEVISREELEERHFTTVAEALNSVSGLTFTSNGGLGSTTSLYLRGMGSNRVLVLIDGINYKDPSNTSGASIQHLMMNDIERIEVIKGAQSGIWGADAAAGVINIITKKAKKGFSGTINSEYGSYDTRKFGTALYYGSEKFDVKFTANKIESNGFTTMLPKGENRNNYENDGYENRTVTFGTTYYINDDSKISFGIKDINAFAQYDTANGNDTNMKSDVDTTLYNLNYSQKIENHNLNLKYELSKFKRYEIGTAGSIWGESVLEFEGKTQNIELSDTYSYLNKDFLIYGFGANKSEVDYLLTDNSKNSDDSKSKFIYLTNTNSFNDKFILTQSLRFDSYNNFDDELTGKIGAKYNFTKDLAFKTNYGTAYNVPSIMQELNPWGTANSNLQPEKSQSFDIGFEYKEFSFTYFESKVKDLISWESATSRYLNQNGKSKFKGIEFAYKKLLTEDTLLGFNYTLQSAKDEDGDDLARRAKELYKASIDYYGFDKFHINVNAEYIGDRYDNSSKTIQTGNYGIVNSVINYEASRTLSLYLKVDNMFGTNYQTVNGYATAGLSAYAGIKVTF
ncbi:TonB-dependent receptor plug domain-containing protein [Halarcobacter ebronensis]|uniref:TonB-dependent receptor n=1 Tax=Halarcobacter ebronensis TaxID=1462615 RepID=A0A4Q1AMJ0_9BACT|nr:TonB-dependent receptor [Halarcobacter ebronensis]QKF82166.1 TonB-dependent receptor [Halarcobacter ebronensis]RXK03455.1 TonB-dependent receptor [Halarcobacter ebronensis]